MTYKESRPFLRLSSAGWFLVFGQAGPSVMTRDLKNTSQFIQNISDVAFLGHKLHGSCCLVKVVNSLLLESSCIEKRTKKSLRHCTPLFGKHLL